jgi:hypothetical protein
MSLKMEKGKTWEISGGEKKKLEPQPAPSESGFDGGEKEKLKLVRFYCSLCKTLVAEVPEDLEKRLNDFQKNHREVHCYAKIVKKFARSS